jgi:outer membrane protein insertion porin family
MDLSASPRPLRRGPLHLGVLAGAALLWLAPALTAQIPDEPLPIGTEGIAVDSIDVVGNVLLDRATIIGTFGVPVGQTITYREIQEGLKRMAGTGRFEDLQVSVRGGDDEPVILTLRVEERPAIRRLVIEGLQNLSAREVRDSLAFRAGEPYAPDRVVRAQRYIQEELARKGIPFARIEVEQIPVPDRPGEVDLRLEVTEGHRVAVAQVTFQGNEAFTDRELGGVLGTRKEGFLWFRSGQFEESVLEEDLTVRLPEFYASNGFLDFQVLSDTVVIDPETGKGRLEVAVEEGPRYRMADFSVEGNRRFPTSELERYYQAEEGGLLRSLGIGRDRTEGPPVFDRVAFMEATRRIEELYRNSGYLYVDVQPVIDRRPAGEEEPWPTVAVRWAIEEGQPAYVRRVHITGNDFTYDRIIRERISVLPGQIYSEQDILRSYQAISGLGFFETPLPFPDIQPDPETGDVDITFEVRERQTGSVNFGTAMGGVTGISGFLGYDQPNLFGQGKSGSLQWQFGRFQNNFTLSYTDPSLFQSRVSGSISLFDSRDRFFSFATGDRKRRGFLTRFGFPIPGAFNTRVFAGYSLSRTDFRLRRGVEDTSLFGRPPGTQSQLSLGLTRNTVDHPIFPSVGSELRWTTEITGGFLGGDGDFTKHQAEGTWWVPVGQFGGGSPGSRPVRLALGLAARGGAIFGDADRFPFDRFWLGGVQFGETLRGYEETTITPRGHFPRGAPQVVDIDRLGDAFFAVGAEYAIRLSEAISVSAFYEAGNVWRDFQEIDPTRLFRGAGMGVQLVTPFGPIGLDYAYGFDRVVPGWELHFRMGGMGMF